MPRQRKATSSPAPTTATNHSKDEFFKCSKCPKKGRKTCSMKACFTCCTDRNCEGHREQYEKESIIEGTHPLQELARKQRAKTVKHGAFRDAAFNFLGETINVWNFQEYMKNPKWRDESIRKSRRYVRDNNHPISRKTISKGDTGGGKRKHDVDHNIIIGGRRKRFKARMDDLYKKSLDS